MAENEELKPCPFCGRNTRLVQVESAGGGGRFIWIIECRDDDCEAGFEGHARKCDAIKAWNRRTEANPWRYVKRDGNPTEQGDYIVACAIDYYTYTRKAWWSGTAWDRSRVYAYQLKPSPPPLEPEGEES